MQISSIFLTVMAVVVSSVYASPAPALQSVNDGYCWVSGCDSKQEKDCSGLGEDFVSCLIESNYCCIRLTGKQKSTPVYSDGKLVCFQPTDSNNIPSHRGLLYQSEMHAVLQGCDRGQRIGGTTRGPYQRASIFLLLDIQCEIILSYFLYMSLLKQVKKWNTILACANSRGFTGRCKRTDVG